MFKRIAISTLLLSLSLGVQIQEAIGPEVLVILSDETQYTGELLCIRETTIVLSLRHGAGTEFLAQAKNLVLPIPQDHIRKLALPGSSNVLPGMAIGLGGGCLAGCLIGGGRSTESSNGTSGLRGCNEKPFEELNNAAEGAAIGGLVGTLAGVAIGSAVSDKEVILIDQNNRDFSGLKALARYKAAEPEFLREIK